MIGFLFNKVKGNLKKKHINKQTNDTIGYLKIVTTGTNIATL